MNNTWANSGGTSPTYTQSTQKIIDNSASFRNLASIEFLGSTDSTDNSEYIIHSFAVADGTDIALTQTDSVLIPGIELRYFNI